MFAIRPGARPNTCGNAAVICDDFWELHLRKDSLASQASDWARETHAQPPPHQTSDERWYWYFDGFANHACDPKVLTSN